MAKRIVVAAALAGATAATDAPVGPRGYLARGAFDVLQVISPAPVTGDPREVTDRATCSAEAVLVA